jgi:Xrn1 helical domain
MTVFPRLCLFVICCAQVPCDPNGKPMPWLWVVLLPFIDERRLLEALHPLYRHVCNTCGECQFLYFEVCVFVRY